MRNYVRDLVLEVASTTLLPHRWRPTLLRWAGVDIAEKVLIMPGLRVGRDGAIKIGQNVFINYNCYIDAEADIEIGDRVQVADHVRFVTSTHRPGGAERRAGPAIGIPIKVGSGCWIGSGVTILPGSTIGAGCVIAAGSVVKGKCEPNALYAGVPATLKKRFDLTKDDAH